MPPILAGLAFELAMLIFFGVGYLVHREKPVEPERRGR
jgi:hypothetical protein